MSSTWSTISSLLLLQAIFCFSISLADQVSNVTESALQNNATAATAASDTGLPDEAATTTTTSAADAVEESLTTTTPTMAAESGGAGGAAVVENPAPPDDRILGMPIPVFATVVSFFGTPIVFIMLCGFVAACKSLSCRRAVDQRSGKVAPSDSLASESFDTDGGKQGRLEMTEFSAVGKSWPGQRANEEVEAEPPPFKAIRTAEDDERIKRKQQQPQQQQQKLRNPYLEQLGQILK